MEITTIAGLFIGIGGIIFGNYLEGGHLSSLIQGTAAVIVFSGTAGAVILSSKKKDLILGVKLARKSFLNIDPLQNEKLLAEIIECAKIARKESILSLEPKIDKMKNLFLQNVMRTVVDGVDPIVIRGIFEKQIELRNEKLNSAAKVWTDAGGYSPTVGIIGAVLGLIHVMGNLTDTSKLGAGIAVAFVATVYGVASANLVFLPLASKIKKNIAAELNSMDMILEGGISILSGLTPSHIDLKLKSYIEKSND